MGWSTTAPTVKSWEQEKPTTFLTNYWKLETVQSIGKTSGKGFAVKVVVTVSNGSYGSFVSPGKLWLQCNINGATGTANTDYTVSKGTVTYYFVGEAASGVPVVSICGSQANSDARAAGTVSFTAPKTSGNVYVNVNGSWKQATAYINVGGLWKEAQAKINVGGEWK